MATGRLEVTTGNLESAAQELSRKNDKLREKLEDLRSAQNSLTQKWDGEANTAFDEAFQNDAKQIEAFIQLVGKYVTALQKIQQAYVHAEQTNKQTASNRSYGK